MPWTIPGATKDARAPRERRLYGYQSVGFTLEVYRDRLVVHERFPGTHSTLTNHYHRLVRIRCLRGQLLVRIDGGVTIIYDLGPAAAEVCELVSNLL